MSVTSTQLTEVEALVAVGDTLGAVEYLLDEGYNQPYAMRRVADAQQIDYDKTIVMGAGEEMDAIISVFNGRRFVVTTDGVNEEEFEGCEFIFTGSSWKNSTGYWE